MLTDQHINILINRSILSGFMGFLTVSLGIDSADHTELEARIANVSKSLTNLSLTSREYRERIWNDPNVIRAYQIAMKNDFPRLVKLMFTFSLANFCGSCIGSLITTSNIEKKLSDKTSKTIGSITINSTIAALFTLWVTRSSKLSIINGIATTISQLVISNPIEKS